MYRLFFGLSLLVFILSIGKQMFTFSKEGVKKQVSDSSNERHGKEMFANPINSKLIKLDDAYCVSFGSPDAKIKVVEYFSFSCPSCIRVFQKDFQKIKEKYIDTKEIYWVFHPVPIDLATVQALSYLEKMTPKEKRVFLTAVLDEAEIDSPETTIELMKEAVIAYHNPLLMDDQALSKAKEVAFKFALRNQITAIPFLEVDVEFYEKEIPDLDFISKQVEKRNAAYAPY